MDTEIYRDLGRIGAQIDTLTKALADQREEDRKYKEYLEEKLDLLEETAKAVKDASPIIKDIKIWRERTIGAMLFASSISAIVAAYGVDFIHFIRAKVGI
jgi:hypothetical protein